MRISDERYHRDLRRLNLALALIQHEVRTQSVILWSGLARKRLVNLRAQVLKSDGSQSFVRHRGPAPTTVSIFFDTVALHDEAAAVAVLCQLFEVLPATRGPQALVTLPSVGRGERLCRAYEGYRVVVPKPQFSLDQVILLVNALTLGEQVRLAHCEQCAAAILIDLGDLRPMLCTSCVNGSKRRRRQTGVDDDTVDESVVLEHDVQGSLF